MTCEVCHHEALLNVNTFGDAVPVPSFGPRMVCTRCGIIRRICPAELERTNRARKPDRPAVALKPILARSEKRPRFDACRVMEEAAMFGKKAILALAVITALGVLGTASAALAKGGRHSSGNMRPCSLDGVNPVYHPQIFGNAAVAREYGFIQSRDGTWQVRPNCHINH